MGKSKIERRIAQQEFQAKVDGRKRKRESSKPTMEQFAQAIRHGMDHCPATMSAQSGLAIPVLQKLAAGNFTPSTSQMKQTIHAAYEMGWNPNGAVS
jgi:hypothetical protein